MIKIKKSQMSIQEIIVIILSLIVLAAVIILIVKPDILSFVRNLPTYQSEGDKVIEINIDKATGVSGCPLGVGRINNNKIISPDGIDTNLLWKETTIQLSSPWYKSNPVIGTITDRIIKINPEWFDFSRRSGYSNLPPVKYLMYLDGAFYFGVNNLICAVKAPDRIDEDPIAQINSNGIIYFTNFKYVQYGDTNLKISGSNIYLGKIQDAFLIGSVKNNQISINNLYLNNLPSQWENPDLQNQIPKEFSGTFKDVLTNLDRADVGKYGFIYKQIQEGVMG